MRPTDKIIDTAVHGTRRTRRKAFVRSLEETAARAVVTATVTFAVGWALKRMFEKSMVEAAEEGAKAAVDGQHSDPSTPIPA